MVKLTKRRGFNFFRSYYDVYNELPDKDKLAFIDALLNRQFQGEKPENLTGMSKFAYISQTNSIDGQVKGYEDKLISMNKNVPNFDPWQGVNKTKITPTEPIKIVEEVVEKDRINFDALLNLLNAQSSKNYRTINPKARTEFNKRIKEGYTKEDIKNTIINAFQDPWHSDSKWKWLTPIFLSKSDKIDKYLGAVSKESSKTYSFNFDK